MKKKKQQTRNLIVLVVLIVGIVLGLWAMNSNFSLNSKAAGANCFSGIYIKGGDRKCYEVQAQCGAKCCNKVVDNSKCRDSKYNEPNGLKCKAKSYTIFKEDWCRYGWANATQCHNYNRTGTEAPTQTDVCYGEDAKVCVRPGTNEEYCCNGKVDMSNCNK